MKWKPQSLLLLLLLLSSSSILYVRALTQSPPRIVKEPPRDELLFQVACKQNENDKPFFIECEAEGEPAPEYRWIKNGKPFEYKVYGNRMSQQPGRGTLVITSPRDEDLGQYQCFAENTWGTAMSNSVFVRKAAMNSFKDEPHVAVSAEEGKPLKLICHPPDGWPKPKVFWLIQYDDDGMIMNINSSRMTVDPEGNLWFSNVTRKDDSKNFRYVCAAKSPFRNEYKLGNLVSLKVIAASHGKAAFENRHKPVEQYVSRKNVLAQRGKEIELYCIFGGTPLPEIVWSKDGRPIRLNDRMTQGHYGKSLIIKHVDFEDAGSYVCEASNGVGNAKSYSMTLSVLAAPYFTVEPETINAAEGETVEFRCEANGVPEPQIKWIHNGLPIAVAAPNPRRKITKNSVVIEKLDKLDTGNYGCNATSSLGYVYKDVYVNVLASPPEITGSHASLPDIPKFLWQGLPSENGSAAVKIIWLPKTDGKLGSHFFVKYKLRGEAVYLESSPEPEEDYVIVRGLVPGKVYEFKVVAVDGEFMTESETEKIETYGVYSPIIQSKENVATDRWLTDMMLAVTFFLLLILFIVCIRKRNRSGKYDVHAREKAFERRNYPEELGLHEYSHSLDSKSHGRISLNSDPERSAESCGTDSVAEYGDGDAGRFAEDGSFMGQYRQGTQKG